MNPRSLHSVRSLTVAAPIRAPGASPVIPARRDVRELALAALILVATASSRAAEVGTAFTYQGLLEKPAGTPVGLKAPVTCDSSSRPGMTPTPVRLTTSLDRRSRTRA